MLETRRAPWDGATTNETSAPEDGKQRKRPPMMTRGVAQLELGVAAVTTPATLAACYREASDMMRNVDGLQPQESFDELLKYLCFKQAHELGGLSNLVEIGAGREGGTKGARHIRAMFVRALEEFPGSAREVWSDKKFRLSDAALVRLHQVFADVRLADVRFDVRAAALREGLSAELRRGLGIFLTPDDVVRAVVAVASPPKASRVYDPACGAGTFLTETLKFWSARATSKPMTIYGSDINARMLVLTELNLGHMSGVRFEGQVLDALGGRVSREWPVAGHFDYIFTNPPFGVYVDSATIQDRNFATYRSGSRIQSEVLFVEQCLRWLKPGGVLGIVLPRSVLTNDGLAEARAVIDSLASLRGVMNLPPETFISTGTQTTTTVLFLERRSALASSASTETEIPVVDIENVGHDSTGRERAGNQLDSAAHDLRHAIRTGEAAGLVRLVRLPAERALASMGRPAARSVGDTRRRLTDVVVLAQTGRTPARDAYEESGLFVVKVGNLTGQGIDWCPRERNFVRPNANLDRLSLATGDIVLTSSAHNRKYIAQKVDIIHQMPDFIGGRASFVAEVIRLRVRPGTVDPYELLAFLRAPRTRAEIQAMISGQTAHLRPRDLLELPIPDRLAPEGIVAILRRESELSRELNHLAERQRALLGKVGAP